MQKQKGRREERGLSAQIHKGNTQKYTTELKTDSVKRMSSSARCKETKCTASTPPKTT